MPRTSIALALLFVALAASAPAQDRATILAVFAHPDDETTVAPRAGMDHLTQWIERIQMHSVRRALANQSTARTVGRS
ncbi:MAG: hypothetical protein R2724_10080 [Bryobacterales bacterium]